jgi:hypothetical protein
MASAGREQAIALGLNAATALGSPLLLEGLSHAYYKRAEKETGFVVDPENQRRAEAKKKALLFAHSKDIGKAAPRPILNPGMGRGGSYQFDQEGEVDTLQHGPQASQFVLAHELGHRSIEAKPGFMQQVQRRTYGGAVHPLIQTATQIAAGAFAPSTRRAVALGVGSGYLNQLGTIATEVEATRRGAGYLKEAGIPISPAMRMAQLASYGVGTALEGARNVAIGRGLRAIAGQLT